MVTKIVVLAFNAYLYKAELAAYLTPIIIPQIYLNQCTPLFTINFIFIRLFYTNKKYVVAKLQLQI